MAANDYIRTVNITPLGTSYSWDTPPSWITIAQVGNTDDWTITVAANTGAARNATLTVRHANTSTVDTITVSQAGASVSPTPTPTSGSGAGPTPTPTSGSGAGPTPTPTSGSGSGPTPTPTLAPPAINNFRGVGVSYDEIETLWDSVTRATGNLTITWGINGSYTNVGSGTSNTFNDGSFNLESLQPNTDYYIRMIAANANSSTSATTIVKTATLIVPTPTSGSGAGPTPTPTSGSGAGPTPTPTSGSGAGPTPTPVPTPTVSIFPNIIGGNEVDDQGNTFGAITDNFGTITSYNWSSTSFKFNLSNTTSQYVDVAYIGTLNGETATLSVTVGGTNLAGAPATRTAQVALVSVTEGGSNGIR